MNHTKAQELIEIAINSDPRTAPFGFLSGGSFVLDSSRVFQWFDGLNALAQHILDVEPVSFDLEGEDLSAYKDKVIHILERLKADGFTEALRTEFNQAANDFMVIDWWGRFDELTQAQTEFARCIVQGYLCTKDGDPLVLADEDMDGFVEHLLTCSV